MQRRQAGPGGGQQQPTNTIFLGGLDSRVDQELLHELCLQVTELPSHPRMS